MTNGIILAGGRGTRLGPLAAQISKALVPVGQRPHVVHQIELLRNNGVGAIVVVTSPDTDRQVRDLLIRAEVTAQTVVQREPRGPADALHSGIEALPTQDSVVVLMSDTYLDVGTPFPPGDWCGVNPAPATRSFCYWDVSESKYVDGPAEEGHTPVTIGAYRFADVRVAHLAAVQTLFGTDGEVGMANFLNQYEHDVGGMLQVMIPSWQDIGDVMALARARRHMYISRRHHRLALDDGLLTKSGNGGEFAKQMEWMRDASDDPALASLVPRVHDWHQRYYTMEFIDLPTLSELWLYWPGRPDTWQDILQSIVQRLQRQLWLPRSAGPTEQQMFIHKALERLRFDPEWEKTLAPLLQKVAPLFVGSSHVQAHGDLNFNNILFSLNTGTFKLIDPRGDKRLPWSYELAKLRYSWQGFSEITHNLRLMRRGCEQEAMDEVIHQYMRPPKSDAAIACLFIAGAPLHPHTQCERMLELGHALLRKALA